MYKVTEIKLIGRADQRRRMVNVSNMTLACKYSVVKFNILNEGFLYYLIKSKFQI